MRKKLLICMLLIFVLMLAACGKNNVPEPTDASSDPEIATIEPMENPEDKNITIDTAFKLSGDGVKQENNTYIITKAGTYEASGKLENGQILIQAKETDDITIKLTNCSITNNADAPIYAESANSLTIIAEEYNLIQDSRPKDNTSPIDATIYSNCDLTLDGNGTLIVKGSLNRGIQCDDNLLIKNITIGATTTGTSIRGDKSIEMLSGNLYVTSISSDAIKTKSVKKAEYGNITIKDGAITINSYQDAISAARNLIIGSENTRPEIFIYTGNYTNMKTPANSSTEDSRKALKADNEVIIYNGVITIEADDDCIHANAEEPLNDNNISVGNITIQDGIITITTKDDGIHADGALTINNGDINVITAKEGIEGNTITVNNGRINIYATDDGLNAKKGAKTPDITINNGIIFIKTTVGDTDCIDTNGTFHMNDGTLIAVCGTNANADMGALDVMDSGAINGGTFIILGASDHSTMERTIPTYVCKELILREGNVTIKSADGTEIATFEIEHKYVNLWISSDQFKKGNLYQISVNNEPVHEWTQTDDLVVETASETESTTEKPVDDTNTKQP